MQEEKALEAVHEETSIEEEVIESDFSKSKASFIDTTDTSQFVNIDRSLIYLEKLKDLASKPLKMILLYGEPGSGKSILLRKMYEELRDKQRVLLYETPIDDEQAFVHKLYKDLFDEPYQGEIDFNRFHTQILNLLPNDYALLLLDESQLYSSEMMEKIRLLADSRKIKIIFVLHKTDKEDVIAKEHFQTRIWESIETESITKEELGIYIQKKLLKNNLFSTSKMFNSKNVACIFKYSKGNYRQTNKIVYTLMELYDYYDKNKPSKISYNAFSNKHVEMVAIKLGLIDV